VACVGPCRGIRLTSLPSSDHTSFR
jgi:hypothetical protein